MKKLTEFLPNEIQSGFLIGPAGQLEAILSSPKTDQRPGVAVICHPHPLFQGSMHNKIVTTLFKAYDACGYRTVRFNFRGVEKSEGSYGKAKGEVDDLLSVLKWAGKTCPGEPIHLAGFSFGGYVALWGATQYKIASLITVAPSIEHFDARNLSPITCPWVVIQGEQDDVVPEQAVLNWLKTRNEHPQVLLFPEAGHFFHGKIIELRERLIEVIATL